MSARLCKVRDCGKVSLVVKLESSLEERFMARPFTCSKADRSSVSAYCIVEGYTYRDMQVQWSSLYFLFFFASVTYHIAHDCPDTTVPIFPVHFLLGSIRLENLSTDVVTRWNRNENCSICKCTHPWLLRDSPRMAVSLEVLVVSQYRDFFFS